MNTKLIFILCLVFSSTQAAPQQTFPSQHVQITLKNLDLTYKENFDYNQYILQLESVIEAAQKAAIDSIEGIVDLAQEFAKVLSNFVAQQTIRTINNIQSQYFELIENRRHQAFEKEIDVSKCALAAIKTLRSESKAYVINITLKMNNISEIFKEYTSKAYIVEANATLEKTYTIRERIYDCPFVFGNSTPFYVCLVGAAVLEDVVLLNDFVQSVNDTIQSVKDLAKDFKQAADMYQSDDILAFNNTAKDIFDDNFVPCTQKQGLDI